MHGELGLGGPVYWFAIVVLFLAGALSLYVVVDGARRPALDFAALREGRWFYVAAQSVYLAAFAVSQLRWTATTIPWLPLGAFLLTPAAMAQQVAYLLRVTFPTADRLAARSAAQPEPTAPRPGGPDGRV